MQCNSQQLPGTMEMLQQLLLTTNLYAKIFQHAYQVLKNYDMDSNVSVRLQVMPGNDPR